MSNSKTRKDVVKNVAIVFLAVMLVLTFFSNTIMNWSLAEVGGKYTEYGAIRTGVRGTGTVAANSVLEQSVKGSQRVVEVFVREGDSVVQGQVLMTLESTEKPESVDVESLRTQLASLKDVYDRAILTRDPAPDYTLEELDIAKAREALDALIAKRALFTEERIGSALREFDEATLALAAAEAAIEAIEEEIRELSEKSDDEAIVAARKRRDNALAALEYAKEEHQRSESLLAEVVYTDLSSFNTRLTQLARQLDAAYATQRELYAEYAPLFALEPAVGEKESAYNNAVAAHTAKQNEYDTAVAAQTAKQNEYDTAVAAHTDAEGVSLAASLEYTAAEEALAQAVADYDKAVLNHGENSPEALEKKAVMDAARAALDAKKSAMDAARSALDSAVKALEDAAPQIKAARADIKAVEASINNLNYEKGDLEREYSDASDENALYERRRESLKIAEKILKDAEGMVEDAESALTLAVESVSRDLSDRLKSARSEKKSADERLAKASEEKSAVEGVEALDARIESDDRALFEMELSLKNRKEADKKAEAIENYDLKKQLEEIQSLEKRIEEAENVPEILPTEYVAKYNGTLISFNCRTGEQLPDGSVVAAIESPEGGYTLSFSVSLEDSRKVQVGDSASVTGGWWGSSIEAVLSGIKTDMGGRTKTLTFDIFGDVSAGQTLTLTAGERSSYYDAVVPKSAVREDADGKFVYVTKTKSTPLGNRYVVTRLPVNVVASDDVNSAIATEETYVYEYVITSTTKPITDGDYVRLAD